MAPRKVRAFDSAPTEHEKTILVDETDPLLTNCLRRHLSRISKEKASVTRDPLKKLAIVFVFKSGSIGIHMNVKNKHRQTRVIAKLSNDGRESPAKRMPNDPMDIVLSNENFIPNCSVETSSNEGRRNSNDSNSCPPMKSGEHPMINRNGSSVDDDVRQSYDQPMTVIEKIPSVAKRKQSLRSSTASLRSQRTDECVTGKPDWLLKLEKVEKETTDFYDKEIAKVKVQLKKLNNQLAKLIKSKEKARREIRKQMAQYVSTHGQ